VLPSYRNVDIQSVIRKHQVEHILFSYQKSTRKFGGFIKEWKKEK